RPRPRPARATGISIAATADGRCVAHGSGPCSPALIVCPSMSAGAGQTKSTKSCPYRRDGSTTRVERKPEPESGRQVERLEKVFAVLERERAQRERNDGATSRGRSVIGARPRVPEL